MSEDQMLCKVAALEAQVELLQTKLSNLESAIIWYINYVGAEEGISFLAPRRREHLTDEEKIEEGRIFIK